jgi:hypothetical protein
MITNWRAPALKNSTTGSNNVALGYSAGSLLSEGSNNVYVANSGEGDESGVIRIGTPNTQTATYIAGIEKSWLGFFRQADKWNDCYIFPQ